MLEAIFSSLMGLRICVIIKLLNYRKRKIHIKIFESPRRDQTSEASSIEAFYTVENKNNNFYFQNLRNATARCEKI